MTIKKHLKKLILPAVLLFFTLRKGGGIVFITLVPIFVLVVLYHLFRILRDPETRIIRSLKIGIWIAAFVLSGLVQSYWAHESRRIAGNAAQAVIDYWEKTGRYPQSLKEAGLDEERLSVKWKIRYFEHGGNVLLTYPQTLMPLSAYEFDFIKRKWNENVY